MNSSWYKISFSMICISPGWVKTYCWTSIDGQYFQGMIDYVDGVFINLRNIPGTNQLLLVILKTNFLQIQYFISSYLYQLHLKWMVYACFIILNRCRCANVMNKTVNVFQRSWYIQRQIANSWLLRALQMQFINRLNLQGKCIRWRRYYELCNTLLIPRSEIILEMQHSWSIKYGCISYSALHIKSRAKTTVVKCNCSANSSCVLASSL